MIDELGRKKSSFESTKLRIFTDKEKNEYVANREELERKKQTKVIWENWSSMTGRFVEASFETFVYHGEEEDQNEQHRIINELLNLDLLAEVKSGKNILFIGPPGTGKDHLLFCLLRTIWEQLRGTKSVKYMNGADFRYQARKSRCNSEISEEQFIKKFRGKKIFCLSDPAPTGGEPLSASQADVLYHALEHRVFEGLPTWMTINLPPGETLLSEATRIFTAPVWERIKHRSITVLCNWQSYRKPARIL
ncbi:DNA replication protein DnaC [Thalassoglobus polymorphus]|uniref:DNA replication protein DnaC n=1 Tax=Thalassoglobus polymorphus TaxID=2527994 RepID=A0A517QK98_9PLAN|nr:DNA replication protein DnaC [Thalassoglobus polymorphus]